MSSWRALHERSGCSTSNGLGMLAYQAALQMQWWWDVPIDGGATLEGDLVTDTLGSSMSSRIRSKDRLDLGLACGLIALGVTGVVMIYSATRQGSDQRRRQPALLLGTTGLLRRTGHRRDVRGVADRLPTPRDRHDAALRLCRCRAGRACTSSARRRSAPQRWYSIGILQIQPSEFTVLILILAIATYCQRRPDGLTMYDVARLLVMSAVPLVLIVLQPDLGTSIIIVLTVGAMLVIAGVPPRLLTLLAVLGSSAIVAGVLPRPGAALRDRPIRRLPPSELDQPAVGQVHLQRRQRQERHRLGRSARRRSLQRAADEPGLRPRTAHRLHLHGHR